MSLSTFEMSGNVCKVIAHQAKGLKCKGKDHTNNAFVTFALGKNKFATSVLNRTQSPAWNEECEFIISDHGGTLELAVCHSDFMRERFLGRVEISVSGIAASYGKCIRKWYKLQARKGKEGKKTMDRGQLEVTVQILHRPGVDVGVTDHDKRSPLLNLLPSPGTWRRRSSGTSSDDRRKNSHSAQEDYLNDINTEMQFNDQGQVGAFYSDDSYSVASSMSDEHRQQYHRQTDIVERGRDQKTSAPATPEQKPPIPHNRFRPGGITGSARGKGGLGKNVKNAFGNITKALSKEHINKVGLSTPDLRIISGSEPPSCDEGLDEPDSGRRTPSQGKEHVHLGVSSLVGSLHPPSGPLPRAVSEENLAAMKEKERANQVGQQPDVLGYTTLPRGKHVRSNARHKKTQSACYTTLSELSHHGNQGSSNPAAARRKAVFGDKEEHRENKENKEPMSSGISKYDTLSRQQLVHLLQQQESILSDNIDQIKELEKYIEKLLLRVMVESPQLLDQNHPIRL